MAVMKIPQDDPPADSSSGEDESESGSERESEPKTSAFKVQPAAKESESELESESESSEPIAASRPAEKKPVSESESESSQPESESQSAKRKVAAESPVEAVKKPKTTVSPAPTAKSPASKSKVVGTPVREDCWSEEATAMLIEEWGRRYEKLKQLPKKEWKEVADAVNAVHGLTKKTERTEMQCKNRIDTIKKKYKLEKEKPSSSWAFFQRMDAFNSNPSATVAAEPMEAEPKKTEKKLKSSRKETETKLQPKPKSTDWAVLSELFEGSLLPESMLTRGLALIPEHQKADLAAQFNQLFLFEIELSANKNMLISNLNRLIFEALKSNE